MALAASQRTSTATERKVLLASRSFLHDRKGLNNRMDFFLKGFQRILQKHIICERLMLYGLRTRAVFGTAGTRYPKVPSQLQRKNLRSKRGCRPWQRLVIRSLWERLHRTSSTGTCYQNRTLQKQQHDFVQGNVERCVGATWPVRTIKSVFFWHPNLMCG